ncbi:MAG: HipA domain-containing protein [Candidatus Velthaea sp.]
MAFALEVLLAGRQVGTLTNLGGDYNLFSFDDSYLEDEQRPILSQAFIARGGNSIRIVPRTHRVAPPFFANLLPEDGSLLRAIVARQYGINRTRDFPYLRALGRDLPGAVVIDELTDAGSDQRVEEPRPPTERPLRFSLAGVQPKFSASMAGDRLTIPIDATGSWIAKLPTNAFPLLPQNEQAMMSFARSIGLQVPQTGLVELDSIEGLPADLPSLRAGEPRQAYIISRFDRLDNGDRVHVEDVNQIANQTPEDKYDNKSSSWIANVIATICPPEDTDDFIRRLVFGICIGNNDMHLKNWAIAYPDGRNARLAPLYDYVCTREYYPNGQLALTVGGERNFELIGRETLRAFAQSAEISARRTLVLADEVVTAVRDGWATFEPSIDNPSLKETLKRHFSIVPLMKGR